MRAGIAFVLALVPATLFAAPPATASKPVDVVLCLDTSNSMDGLLDSAKRKLWAVVNELAKMEPTPNLRVALYSYGNNTYDAKKGWVRREVELTTDLDEVYKRITSLRCAAPGSDEYVARVCRDALAELKWTDDKDGLRLLFVCGNEPVDQDKEVSLDSVAATAKEKGVLINTIYCGAANHQEALGWATFAAKSTGKYASIDQNKAAAEAAIKTPYDEEIEKLGLKINETYCWYGHKGAEGRANQSAADGAAKRAADSVAVERSVTKAGGLYRNAENDLIDRMKSEKEFDLKKIKETDLPDELRKLNSDERLPYLQKKAAEREEIQKKVAQLSSQRALFIEDVRAKQAKTAGDKALDEALRSILREQAKTKGLKVKD
jgi:hypothetical protein